MWKEQKGSGKKAYASLNNNNNNCYQFLIIKLQK